MNAFILWARKHRGYRLIYLAALPAALLVLASLLAPGQARADGGGWPTATWTPLPTWTPIPSATSGGIIFLPTPTQTADAAALFAEDQISPAISESDLEIQAQVQEDQPRSLTSFLCWPIGIVALLLLFVGAFLLRNRLVKNS